MTAGWGTDTPQQNPIYEKHRNRRNSGQSAACSGRRSAGITPDGFSFSPSGRNHGPGKNNERYAYLYGFESYWVAFEHSAYQLCRLFPRSDTSIIRFVTYPFPVVMASITDTELCAYSRRHILKAAEPDRRVLTAEKLSFEHYREWHRTEVEELT